MLKNDPEFLIQILDDYSSGATHSLEMLAKRNGISVRTIFMWARDKSLVLDYMGRQNITFGQAMAIARNVAKAIIVSRTLESYVAEGRRCEVWHHGRPQFEEDESLVALGEEFVRDVLGLPDMFKRDLNGNRIIATRVEYAPAQLIEKYAASNLPAVYGNKSEVTMKGQVSLGVTTIGQRAPLPLEVQAMQRGEITDTVKVAQLAPTTDTPAQYEPTTDTPEQYEPEPDVETVPEPVQIIRDIPPKDFIAPPTRPVGVAEVPLREPRNAMEKDLFQRLAAAREKASQS
ncbi:hypothetical protein [Bradyrhizobium sp. Ash2021]|uniref:hypothetical protein n=1 Tax=Bradyrhizobium sp. Ash2021 TaxID=2954771 RepID=UPI002815D0A5|nr:hypothetical protein [Bradyrhizobium sp. Ash2021]WMT75074.1 hypothetical protein NL528_01120 [Bradyrhizobium sp. Ash2021]